MFEYLGVLIAVILGLSLTHLLRGLSKLIHMRATIKPYWVQIVWTVNILIYVLAVWWDVPVQYAVYIPTIIVICAIGLISKNRRVHGALCIAWLLATVSYVTLSSIDRIALHS